MESILLTFIGLAQHADNSPNSNSRDVLRDAVWMTGMTELSEKMLSKIGISVGKGNKHELGEETLKKADIHSLKTLFTGYNSFADKVSMRANSIFNAVAFYIAFCCGR